MKREFNRQSNVSEEVRSIQDPNMFDVIEHGRDDHLQFIPKPAGKMRQSIDIRRSDAFENQLNGLYLDRLRMPSFSSTIGGEIHKMLNEDEEENPMAVLNDRSFFNQFQFDLETDAKKVLSNHRLFSEHEKKTFWSLIVSKTKGVNCTDKHHSIMKYKLKKQRRKMAYKIRYKVRQDLAIKRLRNKGKFIKSKKLDIRAAANLIMLG